MIKPLVLLLGARSEEEPKKEPEENPFETLSEKKSKQTWARLIKKIYEVDPLICPKCGSEMTVDYYKP